jgi:hypothetical protein
MDNSDTLTTLCKQYEEMDNLNTLTTLCKQDEDGQSRYTDNIV